MISADKALQGFELRGANKTKYDYSVESEFKAIYTEGGEEGDGWVREKYHEFERNKTNEKSISVSHIS